MFNKTYKKQINNKLITHKRYNKSKKNGVNTNKIIKKSKSKRINLKGGSKGAKGATFTLDQILDDIYNLLLSRPFTNSKITDFNFMIDQLKNYNKDKIINILIQNIINLNNYLAVCEEAHQKGKIDKCKNFAKNVKEIKQKLKLIVLLKQIHETINEIDTKTHTKIEYFTSLIAKLVSIKEDEKYDVFIQNLNNFYSSIIEYKKNSNSIINTVSLNSIDQLKSSIKQNIYDIIANFTEIENVNISSTKEPSKGSASSTKEPSKGSASSASSASSAKEPSRTAKEGPASSAKRPVRPTTDIQLIPPTIYVSNPVSNTNNIVYNTSLLSPSEIQQIKKLNLHNKTQKEMEFNTTGRKLIPINQTHYTTFTNVGNSCYLNSALQFLFAIPEIKQIIEQHPSNSNQINALKLLLHFYETNPGKILYIDDDEEKNRNQTIYNQLFAGKKYSQMDVTEFFLLKIFPFIETDPIFIDNFSFMPREEITCINNTKKEKNFLNQGQYDKTLQIELNNETAVNQDLQYYIHRKYDNEEYDIKQNAKLEICETQDNPNGYAKSHKIISFNTNRYIIIYIKRFLYIDRHNSIKLNTKILPNPLIYIDPNEKEYKLKSCIIHIGTSIKGGHYIYLNFDNEGNPLHIIDDSVVYDYDGRTNETHNYITNGYIYLYENTVFVI
jgi:ubiquitin C-terminal hydrolase